MNILQAMGDPKVFHRFFRGGSWQAWNAFAAALFALPMTAEQLAIYKRHTARGTPPTAPSHEAWLVVGRRGGKSFFLAVIAVFLACFIDWRPLLGPGEIGTVMIIAADRKQARVIMRFMTGLLKSVPMLARQIEGATRDSIALKNNIAVEIHTASFRTTRGYTIVAALLDELAYWPTDEASAEPDIEVINAIRPGMATIPDAMLLVASSPHARRGALWDAYRKHFGKDGDPILVWQAATREMNSAVPQAYIDQHVAADPARAAAEYGAQFRTDLEAFVSIEAVRACVAANVFERAPQRNIAYSAFVDPSGGSSDSFTLAIGHIEHNRETVVIDCVREQRPPFSPEIVTSEFAALLKTYRLSSVTGDRYAGEWPVEQFAKYGVRYVAAEKPKSELYTDVLPLINSRRIDLLDHPKLINQLCSLERRTARGGRDSIDHPPNAHDDVANVCAGLASLAITKGVYNPRAWTDDTPDDPHGIEAWRRARLSWYLHSGGIPPPF
jgi:hypothetical protein